ncbi:MAG: biopolymer transporter ExbD [Planctomycetaceae bacterium]
MRVPTRPRNNAFDLQMTAMIDVVFLLLVFFLWTSSFDEPEFDLAGALSMPPMGNASQTVETTPPPFDEIVVRIIQTGPGQTEIRFNDSVMESLPVLQQRLSAVANLGAQPAVIVHPDQAVVMEIAIAVYDTARAAGFDRVLFTVSP